MLLKFTGAQTKTDVWISPTDVTSVTEIDPLDVDTAEKMSRKKMEDARTMITIRDEGNKIVQEDSDFVANAVNKELAKLNQVFFGMN